MDFIWEKEAANQEPMPDGLLLAEQKAFQVISDDTHLILHSDQGWHYQHKKYQQLLEAKGASARA